MKKYTILISIFALIYQISNAQNEVDALRYSQILFGGTARYTAMAGAFSSLGADISLMSTNPGGIGLYKTSEFAFTPTYFRSNTASEYYNESNKDSQGNFNIGNVGFVYTMPVGHGAQGSGFRFVQIGFGLNRLNNFYSRSIIRGTNPDNSLLDAYVEDANGYSTDNLNEYDTKLAYETYLIDPIENTLFYSNRAPLYEDGGIAPVEQLKSTNSTGYINEMDFTIATNYEDIVYFGATIGVPFIRYYEESTYQEFNKVSSDTTYFDQFSAYDQFDTRGTGINFKFGVVVRATDFMRFSAAIHTPSYYRNMRDEYSSSMTSYLNNGKSYSWSSPLGAYNYKLETPLRALGGLSFIFAESGLISADYEFVDYSKAKLRAYDYSFNEENQAINAKYGTASNIRIGAEWKMGTLALRGGYAFYGSPYIGDINDGRKQIFTGGIGYRSRYFFLDLSYNYLKTSQDYYMYESENVFVEPALLKTKSNSFMMTIGFKWSDF